jgi:hypothetical protein
MKKKTQPLTISSHAYNRKATIRLIPGHERCVCGAAFELQNADQGYICSQCGANPERYMVELYSNGERTRLYTDQKGKRIDSYANALALKLSLMQACGQDLLKSLMNHKDAKTYLLENCWTDYKRKLKNPATRRLVEKSQLDTVDFFQPTKDVRTFVQEDVETLYEKLKKGMRPSTARMLIGYLLSCIRYNERLKGMPILGLKPPKKEVEMKHKDHVLRKRHIPMLEEVWVVLRQLAPIDRLACLAIGAHFRRPGEIMAVQAKNLNLTPGTTATLTIGQIGTGLGRKLICSVHDDLVDILRVMCDMANPNDYLFSHSPAEPGNWNNVSHKIRRVARHLGMNATPYEIVRYAFVKHLCEQTGLIYTTCAAMGRYGLEAQRAAQRSPLIQQEVIPSKQDLLRNFRQDRQRRCLRRRIS